jgi:hypothetical protein
MGGVREEIGATATAGGQNNEITSHKDAVLPIMIPKPSDASAIW